MPTYEYACRGCGRSLEVVQSFSDDPLTTCEECGGELRKVFSAAGLIFKGSGWHIKDYAGSGRAGGSTSDSSTRSSSSEGAASSGGSTSAAPASGSGGSGDSGASASSSSGSSSSSSGD
ncbi:MAG: hypothetical protein RLZZ353_222 [Actinomycetota bacterium]